MRPLDTITTKGRFGVCCPTIIGDYAVDILFRMFRNDELALAQGFPEDYSFFGTQEQVTKQIGNAWPGHTAKALVRCLLTA